MTTRDASFPILFSLAVYTSGCSYISTTTEIIPHPKADVLVASIAVADQIGAKRTVGPLNASVWGGDMFTYSRRELYNADLYLETAPRSALNNTMMIGALKFEEDGSSTRATSLFGTPAGDALADSRLYLNLIGQQIRISKGQQDPTVNPSKGTWTYIGLNTLSPILSTNYLVQDNPLLSKEMKPWLYVQNGLGDVMMVAGFIAAASEKDPSKRNSAIGASIGIGVLWRVLTLMNLVDLDDFNNLARTPYDLKQASQ